MLPSRHILYSTILCLILYPFIGFNTIIVWIFSIFIDVDHYIWDIIARKKWNLFKEYKKHKNQEFAHYKYKFHIFHLVELIILLGVLGFYNKTIFYVFIGMLFHYILDWIDLYVSPIARKQRTWSLVMYLRRNLIRR